jgi:hypothetical protein
VGTVTGWAYQAAAQKARTGPFWLFSRCDIKGQALWQQLKDRQDHSDPAMASNTGALGSIRLDLLWEDTPRVQTSDKNAKDDVVNEGVRENRRIHPMINER